MDKIFIAKNVANRLWASENAVDAAIGQASQLLSEMLIARQELNLAATVGNGASAKVAEAIGALSQARTAMVDAHNELSTMQEFIGVRIRSDINTKTTQARAEPLREAV